MNIFFNFGHGIHHVFGGYIERPRPVMKDGRFMLFFDVAVYFRESIITPSPMRTKKISVMLRCADDETLKQWNTWLAENAMQAVIECDEFYMTKGKGRYPSVPVFLVSRFTPFAKQDIDPAPEHVQAFLNAQEGLPANA